MMWVVSWCQELNAVDENEQGEFTMIQMYALFGVVYPITKPEDYMSATVRKALPVFKKLNLLQLDGLKHFVRQLQQQQAGEAEKNGEWDQPAFVRPASPKTARQVGGRARRAGQHDRAAMNASTLPDHATSSVRFASSEPRFVTRVCSATSTSIPQRRNVE